MRRRRQSFFIQSMIEDNCFQSRLIALNDIIKEWWEWPPRGDTWNLPHCPMKIQLANDAPLIDFPITTVGITTDSSSPFRTYMLHCYQCGKTQLRIQGRITRVLPWLEPTQEPVTVDGCRRCGWAFTFQSTKPNSNILFRLPQQISTVFCMICGHEIPKLSTLTGIKECVHCHTPYNFQSMAWYN
jgi:hypothetical protein